MIPPIMSLVPGAALGPYRIFTEVGEGGMGVVYAAEDPRLERDVALEALPEHIWLQLFTAVPAARRGEEAPLPVSQPA